MIRLGDISDEAWDVIVIGAGNAALTAALTARQTTDRVLVLERAPLAFRGGNTRHTRDIRCLHDHADAFSTGSYLYDELWEDLSGVGTGPANPELAAITIRRSDELPAWMTAHGVHWQRALAGTLQLGRTNRFFLGGGKALVNAYVATAQRLGITVIYEATAEDLVFHGARCSGVIVRQADEARHIRARSVVCASGGFEANLDWLAEYWGEASANYVVRGPAYNDGLLLRALYEHGALSAGDEKGFHAVAVDARAPRYDGGIVTRLDCIPFGIVLNRYAERFYDEGEDLWPKRYAIWGRKIAEQDQQIAYCFWDQKVANCFLPPVYGAKSADTVAGIAVELGLQPQAVVAAIDRYNEGVVPGRFDPKTLDACHTDGLPVPKSHWAQRIDSPPYYGVAMRPGITFTYKGVAVNSEAQILNRDGDAFANLFAAGEIMSGNVLTSGYLAGFGLTIGGVWGRIAGSQAAMTAIGAEGALDDSVIQV